MAMTSGRPEGNELAEAAAVDMIKYALRMLEDVTPWMVDAKGPAQPMLAILDMLVFIGEKYPYDINLLLRKEQIEQWKSLFYQWFDRNEKKISIKHREELRHHAALLFEQLERYGH